MNVGETLRNRRVQLRLTRKALAEATGVSVPTISRIERGVSGGHDSTIRRLAQAMDLDPVTLEPSLTQPAATIPQSRVAAEVRKVLTDTLRELDDVRVVPLNEEVVVVPVSDSVHGAGPGPISADAEVVAYVPSRPDRSHRFIGVRVKGSCLSPLINDGEIVVIDKDIVDPHDGDVLAIHVDGEDILRMLAGRMLVSYNGHEPIPLDDRVSLHGVVVAGIRRFR